MQCEIGKSARKRVCKKCIILHTKPYNIAMIFSKNHKKSYLFRLKNRPKNERFSLSFDFVFLSKSVVYADKNIILSAQNVVHHVLIVLIDQCIHSVVEVAVVAVAEVNLENRHIGEPFFKVFILDESDVIVLRKAEQRP